MKNILKFLAVAAFALSGAFSVASAQNQLVGNLTVTGTQKNKAGPVGIGTGTTTPATQLHVVDTGTATPRGITDDQYNTGTNGAQFNIRKARGTLTAPLTVVTADLLGRLIAWGYDGTNFIEGGNIRFLTSGTIAATRVPSQFEVWTSTDATPSVLTQRLVIDNAGHFTMEGVTSTGATGTGAFVFSISPALTGSPTAPTQTALDNSTKIATTAYVDSATTNFDIKNPVVAATTTALLFSPSYANGSSGVGATLTGGVGILIIDGVTVALGNRVLVKNEASTLTQGVYTLTTVGTVGIGYVLTRATDFNQTGNIVYGDSVGVLQGTANANQQFTMNNQNAITVGTTAVTFAQTSGGSQLASGNGITITGNSVAINTAVTADLSTAQGLTNKTLTTPVINGLATGTGVASAATVSTIVTRDANGNINANSVNHGYTTTATAGGTTTLTVASTNLQYFTGTLAQTVVLPVTSTLVLGQRFVVTNSSTGLVTVQSSGTNAIVVLPTGVSVTFTCILTSGTGVASWGASYTPSQYSSTNAVLNAIIIPIKNLVLLTAGSPADLIGPIALPSNFTRWRIGGVGSTTSPGCLVYGESLAGTAAAATIGIYDTAGAGGPTGLLNGGTAALTTVTATNTYQNLSGGQAISINATSTIQVFYVRQGVNSANAATVSLYVTIFPIP